MEKKKIRVSWDIADGGKEWIVQFWEIDKRGEAKLFTQLDKNSDDCGSFDLPLPLTHPKIKI